MGMEVGRLVDCGKLWLTVVSFSERTWVRMSWYGEARLVWALHRCV